MPDVPLPDPIYAEAATNAAAIGQDVDAYVVEAVRQRLDEDQPVTLTPEQIEICARAKADIKAGNFYTAEQVRDHFEAKHAAWAENRQP